MEANNSQVDPTTLIPAAHLPQAVSSVASQSTNNPNVTTILQGLQAQINALMGQQIKEQLPDVILVNPSGRVVAVSGRNSAEYLSKPGFRKATETEEANYHKAILRQTQEFLRRLERKRLLDEKNFMDALEKEGEIVESEQTTKDLQRTTVTDAQKTGALEPEQVAKLNNVVPEPTIPAAQSATTSSATGSSDNQTETQSAPPSRKSNKSTNTSK